MSNYISYLNIQPTPSIAQHSAVFSGQRRHIVEFLSSWDLLQCRLFTKDNKVKLARPAPGEYEICKFWLDFLSVLTQGIKMNLHLDYHRHFQLALKLVSLAHQLETNYSELWACTCEYIHQNNLSESNKICCYSSLKNFIHILRALLFQV